MHESSGPNMKKSIRTPLPWAPPTGVRDTTDAKLPVKRDKCKMQENVRESPGESG